MQSRMERYLHYREKIHLTPDDKFPGQKEKKVKLSREQTKSIPVCVEYKRYRRKRALWSLFKVLVFLVVAALMVGVYFFWVKGN